jgi:hypothetical protein
VSARQEAHPDELCRRCGGRTGWTEGSLGRPKEYCGSICRREAENLTRAQKLIEAENLRIEAEELRARASELEARIIPPEQARRLAKILDHRGIDASYGLSVGTLTVSDLLDLLLDDA